ncbi:MAG: GyrI-like domain-containing protein [Crocinitomicaceae bacterium]
MTSNYQSRINKALKYIDSHLDEDINVKTLAELSGFSMFHFHRIFKATTGETPYESLLRLRLEKSVFLLKYERDIKISEVGYACGFSSAENFSRQFKARYEMSPGAFKKAKDLHNSRIYQEHNPNDFYLRIENSRKLDKKYFVVEIESLPEIPIAYSKAIFGTDGSGMVEKYFELMKWAESNCINIKGDLTRFGMSIDNPEVTPASKFRYDFALKIDKIYPQTEAIEFGFIPKAEYASVSVYGTLENVAQAWDYLYQNWLPNSQYVPMHYPAIEEFVQGPEEIGWETFNLKCRVPIIKE